MMKKILHTALKTSGIAVVTLLLIITLVVTALMFFENHDFSGIDGIEKREFSCCRGDLEIRGTMFMPSGQTDIPIAIVCHEFMTNRLFSYPYAMALAKSGYAAFCFDFCGGGIVCSSDGDSRNMSVLTEIEDLRSVIAFAKEQDYTSDEPLLLMGCSQGGLVAALTAAELPEEIGGLILQYPALLIPDAARKGEMLWMNFDPDNVPAENALRANADRQTVCHECDGYGYASHDYPLYGQGADSPRRQRYACKYLRFPRGGQSLRSCRSGCTLSDHPRWQTYFPHSKTHKKGGKLHIEIRLFYHMLLLQLNFAALHPCIHGSTS